jgi:hypothetical protein
MSWERIGAAMKAHEIMALKAAVAVLRRYSQQGVVDVLATVIHDEEAKRRRMKTVTTSGNRGN